MSYLLDQNTKSLKLGVNFYVNATATLSNGSTVSFDTTPLNYQPAYGFTTGNSGELTFSGSKFTLPNSSQNTFMFKCALVWYGSSGTHSTGEYSYSWYDVTDANNVSRVGSIASITSGLNSSEGRAGTVVADEMAVYTTNTSNQVLELRLVSSNNNYANLTAVDYTGTPQVYYNKARCLVFKLN